MLLLFSSGQFFCLTGAPGIMQTEIIETRCNKYRLLYGRGVPLCHIGTWVAISTRGLLYGRGVPLGTWVAISADMATPVSI